MKLEEWRSQIKRGTLEYCILLLVQQKPRYGYEIMSELEKRPVIAAKESTIYPLLRRLLKEEYLMAFWQDAQEGLPPRKYYTLTEYGAAYLEAVTRESKKGRAHNEKGKQCTGLFEPDRPPAAAAAGHGADGHRAGDPQHDRRDAGGRHG